MLLTTHRFATQVDYGGSCGGERTIYATRGKYLQVEEGGGGTGVPPLKRYRVSRGRVGVSSCAGCRRVCLIGASPNHKEVD